MHKPSLVLLSGWAFKPEVFDPWTALLSDSFDVSVLAYPDFSLGKRLSADERSSLLSDQIEQPALIMGWSLGAGLAFDLAERYPEKVLGVITLGSNPCFVESQEWPGMAAEQFQQFCNGMKLQPEKTLQRFKMLITVGSANQRDFAKRLTQSLYKPSEVLADLLDELAVDRRATVASIAVPHLHLLADQDGLVPITLRERLGSLSKQLSLTVIRSGSHLLFWDQPQACLKSIEGWCSGLGLLESQ